MDLSTVSVTKWVVKKVTKNEENKSNPWCLGPRATVTQELLLTNYQELLFNLASRFYFSLLVPMDHKLYGLIIRTMEQTDKCTDKRVWLQWDSNQGNLARHTPEAKLQTTKPRGCSNYVFIIGLVRFYWSRKLFFHNKWIWRNV